MSIDVFCPECEHELHLPDERMLGRWARCPQCETKFQLLRSERRPVPNVDVSVPPIEDSPPADESDDSEECVQTLEDVGDVNFDDLNFDFSDAPEAEEFPSHDAAAAKESPQDASKSADESGSLPPALFKELFGQRSFDAKRFVKSPDQQTDDDLSQQEKSSGVAEPSRHQTLWIVLLAFLIGSLIGFGVWLAVAALKAKPQTESTSAISSIEIGPTLED